MGRRCARISGPSLFLFGLDNVDLYIFDLNFLTKTTIMLLNRNSLSLPLKLPLCIAVIS